MEKGTFTFNMPNPTSNASYLYIADVREKFTKVHRKGGLWIGEETKRETHLIFGNGNTFYRIIVPYDAIYANLPVARVIPYFSARVRSRKTFRTIFRCNATVDQLAKAILNPEDLRRLLKTLISLKYLPHKRKNQFLEQYLKRGVTVNSFITDILKEDERHKTLQAKSKLLDQKEQHVFGQLMLQLRNGPQKAIQLAKNAYLAYLITNVNGIRGYELYHVSSRGHVRKFVQYGLPFRRSVMRVIRDGGYPKGTEEVTDATTIKCVAEAIGSICPAMTLVMLPP